MNSSSCAHSGDSVAGFCPICLLQVALEHDDDATEIRNDDSDASGEVARFTPGAVLAGRFRIIALIGRGGMGEVYRADDLRLGQPVALKFISSRIAQDPDLLQRLYNEVRLGRQVAHPNVCRLYDLLEYEGHHFVVMEFIDGEDLASLLKRIGRLPRRKALDTGREICAGLAASHDRNVIHGDLKPGNIMIDGHGRARITDFGLSSAIGESAASGKIVGTPAYMAPEQLDGGPLTTQSDLYALGLVLYEMFTGERLHDVGSFTELRHAFASAPRPASDHVRGLPPFLDDTILRCLSNDPAARPASAREVLAAFPGGDPLDAALAAGETPSPELVAAAEPKAGFSVGRSVTMFGAAVLAVVAVVIVSDARSLRLPKSPEVLTDRAQELLRRRGFRGKDVDHAAWFSAEAGGVIFRYRQSPKSLVPLDPESRITVNDPPSDVPGMAMIALTPDGDVVQNAVVVPEGRNLGLQVYLALLPVLLILGLVLARRNMRFGRVDFAGARRIAVWVFVCRMVYALLTIHHVPSLQDESRLIAAAIGHSLYIAAQVWLGYMAIEPYVRRRWPQTIIGWKRLLDGRIRDPLVAGDVLAGSTAGVMVVLMEQLARLGLGPSTASVEMLSSPSDVLSLLFYAQTRAVFYGLFSLFLLVLLRAILRNHLVAGFIWIAVIAVMWSPWQRPWTDLVLAAAAAIILLVVLMRLGLLALIAAQLYHYILQLAPLTAHMSSWYFTRSLMVVAVLIAVMAWACVTVAGRVPFMGRILLEQ